ncbi:hypothetical protein [Shewanella sp. GXUN23E]|uniref:hypothetical protein n=1 Tax=Shewanella sp. GXUN23E TaxID=3422498 RepID=UPI003D7E051C
MEHPNYAEYSITDLQEALDAIDKEAYPERAELIGQELAARDPERVEMPRPDYSNYSVEELNQALRGIDKDAFPDRTNELQQEIAMRMSKPKAFNEEFMDSGFFKSAYPSHVALRVWLHYTLWTIAIGVVAGVPFAFVFLFVLALFGVPESSLQWIFTIAVWPVNFWISYLVLKKSLATRYKYFELVILSRPRNE